MSYEFLQILWFILIAVLWIGFFFLEGFDFGVGMLLPFLGKKDEERRAIINTIGSVWDGNEVWLLTAGGATFAAFPHWYATMFSGFYLALFLLLVGLIIRGISFEYRSKDANPAWRNRFDWMIAIGSFLSAFLLGTAFANLARGVPINAGHDVHRQPVHPAQSVRTARRCDHRGGLPAARRQLPRLSNWKANCASASTGLPRTSVDCDQPSSISAWHLYTYVSRLLGARHGQPRHHPDCRRRRPCLLTGYFINHKMEGWAFIMTGAEHRADAGHLLHHDLPQRDALQHQLRIGH